MKTDRNSPSLMQEVEALLDVADENEAFYGSWSCENEDKNFEHKADIKDGQIIWEEHNRTKIMWRTENRITVKIDKKAYTGTLKGNSIEWSDKEIWVRVEKRSPEVRINSFRSKEEFDEVAVKQISPAMSEISKV